MPGPWLHLGNLVKMANLSLGIGSLAQIGVLINTKRLYKSHFKLYTQLLCVCTCAKFMLNLHG